jgi:hypothetical protein
MPARKGGPLTARVRLTVDGSVAFDDALDEWRFTPPDYFKDGLMKNAKPEPWLKAIMIVMADAALTGSSVSIDATTGESCWSIQVQDHGRGS